MNIAAPTHELDTPQAVITALGGIEAAAELLQENVLTVQKWWYRPSLPANLFYHHSELLAARGFRARPEIWRQEVKEAAP